jgi:hypothetical protein
MKYIKLFEQFVNEANLSDEVLKIKKGDVVIITKDLKLTELNFKKSALTWWGKNISSVLNSVSKDNKNKTYKKGDILFIASKNGKVDSDGMGKLYGYQGGWDSSDEYHIAPFDLKHPYKGYITQIIILALLNGFAKVIPYNSLDKSKKLEFELGVLRERVRLAISYNKKVLYDGMIVTSYTYDSGMMVLSGFDADTKNKMPDKMVDDYSELNNVMIDGKPVNTKPF